MSSVRLEAIGKRYGPLVTLDGIDLHIREGEFVTLLGASGSGKTTCLRIVAGFVSPDEGRVFIGDADVTKIPAQKRNTGMVFQQYALFPHLTVMQNVAFGLKVRRLPSREVGERTTEALKLVQLDGLRDRYPSQLSGGQKQRVALARAVVIRPKILLLDEPLGALDFKLREELQVEIKRVQQTLGITALFVTHDQNEALSMSDRIAVMRDGRILQVATPTELYERPVDSYVASFVGRSNFIKGRISGRESGGRVLVTTSAGARVVVDGEAGSPLAVGAACVVAFRPEAARIGAELPNQVAVTVEKCVYVGNSWTLLCVADGNRLTVTLPAGSPVPAAGSTVTISWAPDRTRLLADPDEETPTPAFAERFASEPATALGLGTAA